MRRALTLAPWLWLAALPAGVPAHDIPHELGGMQVRGDDLAGDVAEIPFVPTWQMTDDEERRRREVVDEFATTATPPAVSVAPGPSPLSPWLRAGAGTAEPVRPAGADGL